MVLHMEYRWYVEVEDNNKKRKNFIIETDNSWGEGVDEGDIIDNLIDKNKYKLTEVTLIDKC